jgi:hypothetical protein
MKLFEQYKKLWLEWLQASILNEKKNKEISSNYGDVKNLSKDDKAINDKQFLDLKIKKQKLDALIAQLKSMGYNTDKMWRDMYMKKTLNNENTYKLD